MIKEIADVADTGDGIELLNVVVVESDHLVVFLLELIERQNCLSNSSAVNGRNTGSCGINRTDTDGCG